MTQTCTCELCEDPRIYAMTDGDYDHHFVSTHLGKYRQCIKQHPPEISQCINWG
jgi:hypothetical protein